jgi:PadR family transcriptional regulator PadR
MSKDGYLGEFEMKVLMALIRLDSNAYGMLIRREIANRTGRDVSIGAIYATLDRMEKKGYVTSSKGEATPERGNRAKRYFQIEAPGKRALDASWEALENMRPDGAVGGLTAFELVGGLGYE